MDQLDQEQSEELIEGPQNANVPLQLQDQKSINESNNSQTAQEQKQHLVEQDEQQTRALIDEEQDQPLDSQKAIIGGEQSALTSNQLLAQSLQQSQKQYPTQQQFGQNIYVITAPWEVAKLSQAIMDVVKQKNTPILGMDCEGLTKNRCMQLIQIYFTNKCFIIDLQAVNPFCYGFKEVMESPLVMKIFHDFCEDASALICQYNLICDFVFDTQIAHRLITDFLQQYDYRNINIGLNHLLEEYLGQYNTKKDEINDLMQENLQFWEQRPLTPTMVEYAAQDVQYLPQVYEKMRQMDVFNKDIIDNVCESGKIYQCLTKLYHKILSDTRKCIGYGFINRNIADVSSLNIDTYILAFIKNIQKRIVFCSLNLGVSGVIKDDESIKNFRDNKRSIGEIIKVQVTGFEKSGKIILKYVEQPLNIISQSHPPQVFFDKNFGPQGKSLMENTKSDASQPGKPTTMSPEESPKTPRNASHQEPQVKEESPAMQSQDEVDGPKEEPLETTSLEITQQSPDQIEQQAKIIPDSASPPQKDAEAVSSDHQEPNQTPEPKEKTEEQNESGQKNSQNSSVNAPFNICAQNTSYNFNNSFYQNYVSNSQKQFNFLVKNAQGGLGQGHSTLQARSSEVVSISNICSSQQMSFRDQKINRVDQSMIYSYNNTNSAGKQNFDYNNITKMPETIQKKVDKNEERSKSEISLEYQAAFNQANLLSEQAAHINNQRKTHVLGDYLDGKDKGTYFNDLNLTFDARAAAQNMPSLNSARNQTSQGRFQNNWGYKQSSTPNANNSFSSPQAQPFYPTFTPVDLGMQIQNQGNFGLWNQQDQMQNQQQQQYGKMDGQNYGNMGGHHRQFKKGFMKNNKFGQYNSNIQEPNNPGHYSSRPQFSKGFHKRQGQLHLDDPQLSTPRHQHKQSFPFAAMNNPSTPMSKPTNGMGQDSMWWRNDHFKSQNRPDYHNLSGKKQQRPGGKKDDGQLKDNNLEQEKDTSQEEMRPSSHQPRRNNWADEESDQDDNQGQLEHHEQNYENIDRNNSGEQGSFTNSNNDQIYTSDFRQSLRDFNQINDKKQGEMETNKQAQQKSLVEVELFKVELDNPDYHGREKTIFTMMHNFQGSERPEMNISTSQVNYSEDAAKHHQQYLDSTWMNNTNGGGGNNAMGGGPQKLINFGVVQKICQQNQIFNEKKKDEIIGEQIQLMNEGQQQNTPIIVLDNPYQDLDKVISKAKSQQKVSQMKKTKSSYSSGSGNKNMDHAMLQFKQDKLQDNDFVSNFNRKLTCQEPMQSMPYMQNPNKPIFQAKNKKKKERMDGNPMAPQGGDKSQRVYSWRNFGNVSAFSQRKQQTFQRAGTQYMKKERSNNFMAQPQDPSMQHQQLGGMPPQYTEDPMSAAFGGTHIPQQPSDMQAQPEQAYFHHHSQQQWQQQNANNNNNNNSQQPNIEINIQINSLSFRNE